MKRLFVVAALSGALLSGCKEDPEKAANKLFVEAMPLWQQYQALPTDDPAQYDARLNLLTKVDENLKHIVADYPESSLAVELVSTGGLKQLEISKIDEEIARVKQDIQCRQKPVACLIISILKAADSITDDESKALVLASVAEAQAASGDNDGAKANIAQALKIIVLVTDDWMRKNMEEEALATIGVAQAASGDIAGALKTADLIREGGSFVSGSSTTLGDIVIVSRSGTLGEIAKVQAASGDVVGALKTVDFIKDPPSKTGALGEIAKAQAVSGDVVGALKTVDFIKDPRSKAWALGDIANAQAVSGDGAGALKTADLITDEWKRAQALGEIAKAQAVSGDGAGARNTADLITDDAGRAWALLFVVKAQAASGDVAEALKTADLITDEWKRAQAIAATAKELAKKK